MCILGSLLGDRCLDNKVFGLEQGGRGVRCHMIFGGRFRLVLKSYYRNFLQTSK